MGITAFLQRCARGQEVDLVAAVAWLSAFLGRFEVPHYGLLGFDDAGEAGRAVTVCVGGGHLK